MKNAIKGYELWKPRFEKGEYRFILMASVQGIEIGDSLKSFEKLCSIGFRHFAIGGLAKRDNEFIKKLITELSELLKRFNISSNSINSNIGVFIWTLQSWSSSPQLH